MQCGENRFINVEPDNFYSVKQSSVYLEFYITNNCEIMIEPRKAIMTKVRLEWNIDDFYRDGGVEKFIERMAEALGVPADKIKVVAAYRGSVIIDFLVEADEDQTPEEAEISLKDLQNKLAQQAEEGSIDLGAPIMGIQADDGELLAGEPIPAQDGQTTQTKTLDDSAIIGDGPNLWDDIIVQQKIDQKAAEDLAEKLGIELAERLAKERADQAARDAQYSAFAQRLFEEAQQLEAEKLLADIEAEKEPETQVVTVRVKVPYLVTPEEEDDSDEVQKYLIIIPSIVAGILIIVAIVIAIKVMRSRRPQQIMIKEQVGHANAHD